MLILLSPTKQMDFSGPDYYKDSPAEPFFSSESQVLNNQLKTCNHKDLMDLMKVSSKIAENTYESIQSFSASDGDRKSALSTYSGTVFKSFDISSLSEIDLKFAENHLRILSGMYGILKPADIISPYRLEMKIPLQNPGGENLYHFWKSGITDYLLNEYFLSDQSLPIINLASDEYFKVIDKKKIKNPIISISFKERSDNKVRTVGMYSKVARGLMARRIIVEKMSDPEYLKSGDTGGYFFDRDLSSDRNWIFVRG